MHELKRFWRSLEVIRGGTTLPAEWKRQMGEQEYSLMQTFFRPTGELATWYPHPDPNYYYYRVVTHGPDDHVGVCDETGERVTIATADLVIHAIERSALQRAVAHALGLVFDAKPIDHLQRTDQIGCLEPLAGVRCPAFWTIPAGPEELEQVIDRFTARQESPFLLLAPTRRFMRPSAEEWLRLKGGCFLSLDDSVGLADTEELAATAAGERAMAELRQRLVPAVADDGSSFFPTPAGATWSQVTIRLADGHTAAVTVGQAHGVYNFVQLGLANRKNVTPSVQWELLRAFAANGGLLTWRSPQANRRNQKRRELLARALRQFFRIERDPFVPCGNGWRALFHIEADSAVV